MKGYEPENVGEMSIREINAWFRKKDESHLWPVRGRFNATERAIRRLRRLRRQGLEVHPGLEYFLALESEVSDVVNAEV